MLTTPKTGKDRLLYICPTPIGNLEDITLRVLATLREADLIAAEDTRRTRKLLSRYDISKPLISYYEHNELKRLPELLERLGRGENIALVSDAGMPGICDPGYRLIKAALDENLPVEVLPGPSAVETALVSSGFSTDAFIFMGYLPRRKGDLVTTLKEIGGENRTCVAFESPHRLKTTLDLAAGLLDGRQIAICRELSKKFEEIRRGSAAELAAALPPTVKGEIVLVFASGEPAAAAEAPIGEEKLTEALSALLGEGLSPRRAAEIVSSLTAAPKNKVYKLALELK